jgi:hypothetical protein
MKMNKILLTAALLVSINALAEGNSIFASLRSAGSWAWAKVPAVPSIVKKPACVATEFVQRHGLQAADWVWKHTPSKIQQLASNKRNLKIAGVVATAAALLVAGKHVIGRMVTTRNLAAQQAATRNAA